MSSRTRRALWTAKVQGKSLKNKGQVPWGKRVHCDGIVLGIDPSLRGTGLAVIEFRPGKQALLKFSQTVKVNQKKSMTECLGLIASSITHVLDEWQIDSVSIEQTIYVQNFQTAQVLGAARGAALAPVAMRDIPIFEYAPLRIKQAVVGFGRASKDQVAGMVTSQLRLPANLPSDEADAAAVALCYALNIREA